MFQIQGVLPVSSKQPVAIDKPLVEHAISIEEYKRHDRFQKLRPPHFDGDAAQDFIALYHQMLCKFGLVESNGLDITTF